MAKVSVTFRLDSELAARLKETAEKSGGKLTQVQIVEAALADKFAVRDSGKLLAKVNESQQTALTLVKEQSAALTEFQAKVRDGINTFALEMRGDVEHLEDTVTKEMKGTSASVHALQQQVASMIGTLRQVEHGVQQAAETRMAGWQWLTIGILLGLATFGAGVIGLSL